MSKLLKGSVVGHLFRLTLPSIGGMLAIMVFNVIPYIALTILLP